MNDEREGMGAAGWLVIFVVIVILLFVVFGAAGMAALGG